MLIVGHLFLQQSLSEVRWSDEFSKATATKRSDGGNEKSDIPGGSLDKYSQMRDHKDVVSRKYICANAGKVTMLCQEIMRGDRSTHDRV